MEPIAARHLSAPSRTTVAPRTYRPGGFSAGQQASRASARFAVSHPAPTGRAARTVTVRKVSPRRRLAVAAALALVITGFNFLPQVVSGASASNQKGAAGSIHWVSVRSGDTLWSLAQQYAPNTDPREWVDTVTTINNVGSAGIFAGERLAIPTK